MNNSLKQILQQGMRIAMGATVSCIETLQDPQKRAETIKLLQTELNQKIQEWSVKGEVTEAEVKALIDHWLAQGNWENYSSTTDSKKTKTSPQNNSKLQELTQEIIALKLELEKLRKAKGK